MPRSRQGIALVRENSPLWSSNTYSNVVDLAISSDGEYIVAGTFGAYPYPTLFLFHRTENVPVWTYATGNLVGSVAISFDGSYIAAVCAFDGLCLFGRQDNVPLWSYPIAEGSWGRVAISADGSYIAVENWDKLSLFHKDVGLPLWSYETKEGPYSWLCVAISADGSYVAACCENNKVCLFARTDNTLLWSYQIEMDVYSVSISLDGNYVAASSWSGLHFFDKSGELLWSFVTPFSIPSNNSISGDGKHVAIGDGKGYVNFFSTFD
jgi:hypothetical protein